MIGSHFSPQFGVALSSPDISTLLKSDRLFDLHEQSREFGRVPLPEQQTQLLAASSTWRGCSVNMSRPRMDLRRVAAKAICSSTWHIWMKEHTTVRVQYSTQIHPLAAIRSLVRNYTQFTLYQSMKVALSVFLISMRHPEDT